MTGQDNIAAMFARADATDRAEGLLAYIRYHKVMNDIAHHYGFTVGQVTAAFVSLSPNSDYMGNLRSTVTVLKSIREGTPPERTTVATYRHCMHRAWQYATGTKDFLTETKGPKITNFFRNVLNPMDENFVTIDGHMVGIWRGLPKLVMKEALIPLRDYRIIAQAVKDFACAEGLIPNQVQAILWFTRKRTSNVVYDPQMSLLGDGTDQWKTLIRPEDIKPYVHQYPTAGTPATNPQGQLL